MTNLIKKIDEWQVRQKHLQGKHDQRLHGNRGLTVREASAGAEENVDRMLRLAGLKHPNPSDEYIGALEKFSGRVDKVARSILKSEPSEREELSGTRLAKQSDLLDRITNKLENLRISMYKINKSGERSGLTDEQATAYARKIDQLALAMNKMYHQYKVFSDYR